MTECTLYIVTCGAPPASRVGDQQYPVFVAAKRTWEGVLEALPPKATQAIKHHILPAAHQAMGQLNRDRRQTNRDRER